MYWHISIFDTKFPLLGAIQLMLVGRKKMEDISDAAAINLQHSFHLREEMEAAITLCHLSIKYFSCSHSNHAALSGFEHIEMCVILLIMQGVCGDIYALSAVSSETKNSNQYHIHT